MTKDEAEAKIEALLDECAVKVKEAQKIADEHGLEFVYEPENIGRYYGKGTDGVYGADDENGIGEGEWYPSSWSSSSLGC